MITIIQYFIWLYDYYVKLHQKKRQNENSEPKPKIIWMHFAENWNQKCLDQMYMVSHDPSEINMLIYSSRNIYLLLLSVLIIISHAAKYFVEIMLFYKLIAHFSNESWYFCHFIPLKAVK